MSIEWKISTEHRLVTFRLSDESRVFETIDAVREVTSDPQFSADMRRLYIVADDFRPATTLDTTLGPGVDHLSHQIIETFAHPATVAFVFSDGNWLAKMRYNETIARCNQLYSERGLTSMDAAQFRNVAAALEWLGITGAFIP